MKRHSKKHYSNINYPNTQKDYPSPNKKKDRKNWSIYLFSLTLFIAGYISGNGISYELNTKGLLSIVNSILENISLLSAEKSFSLLLKSFFTHFVYIFMIWFLSLTIIGIIIVIFIVFFEGFMYGVVISSFTYQLGLQGFIVGFFYTFPQNIILIPLVIYTSGNSMRLSIAIFKNFFHTNNRKYLKDLLNQYYNQLFFAVGVLIIYALIMSIFGKTFINILKSLV